MNTPQNLTGLQDLAQSIFSKGDINRLDDSILKIALQHSMRPDCMQSAGHRDKHTDHSECVCFLGGL